MSPLSTAGFRFGEVRGVAVAYNYHVAGVVGDGGIGVSGCVIEKFFHLLHCLFIWGGLLGGNGSECCEHFWIDYPRLVKENTCHFLNKFLIFWGERWGRVGVRGVLSCFAIDWFDVWVGLVLGFARMGVVETFESGCDIFEDG